MNSRTYKKIEELAAKVASKRVGRDQPLSNGSLFLPSLTSALGSTEEDAVEPVEMIRLAEFASTNSEQNTMLERRHVDQILTRQRPAYWPGWAHRSEYVSSVIEEPFAKQYARRMVLKVRRGFNLGVHRLRDTNIKIKRARNNRSCLDILTTGNNIVSSVFQNRSNTFQTAHLLHIWALNRLHIEGDANNPRVSLRFGRAPNETKFMETFQRDLYTLLSSVKDPIYNCAGFDFYDITYMELMCLVLFWKFPRRFPLDIDPMLASYVIRYVTRELGIKSAALEENATILVLWNKDPIKRRALFANNYSRVNHERKNSRILSEEAIKEECGKGIFQGLTNKDFFDYEGFLSRTTEDITMFRENSDQPYLEEEMAYDDDF